MTTLWTDEAEEEVVVVDMAMDRDLMTKVDSVMVEDRIMNLVVDLADLRWRTIDTTDECLALRHRRLWVEEEEEEEEVVVVALWTIAAGLTTILHRVI